MATQKTTARKASSSKKAASKKNVASKTATAKTAPRKTAARKTAAKKTSRPATKQVHAHRAAPSSAGAVDIGKQLLADGLSKAQTYASKGKRSLAVAGKAAKSYGEVAAREIRKNPKVAAAVAAGVISVGSAMLVRKIQKGGNGASAARLADKAQRATTALASKATEVTQQLADRIKDISARH